MEVMIQEFRTMPASVQEISLFLKTFKKQARTEGLIYYNWEDNLQELLFLEISARKRERIILKLDPEDYVDGPYPCMDDEAVACWLFRSEVNDKAIEIEISLADDLGAACCYSFAAK